MEGYSMTSYTGKCLLGIKAKNLVTDVQVVDTAGNSIPLPLDVYLARRVKPDYKTLPWCEDIGKHG
jgi:hypothetical protein